MSTNKAQICKDRIEQNYAFICFNKIMWWLLQIEVARIFA